MKKLIFLLLTLSFFSCKDDESTDSIDLRNTLGEITMELNLENPRWGSGDLNVVFTLKNDPKANPELEKYLKDVGGQEFPTELSIDWGDGTVNSQTTHIYAKYGRYKVVIKGRGINWFSDESINRRSITDLDLTKCPTLQGIISQSESRRPANGNYSFHAYPYLEYLDYNHTMGTKRIDISRNKYIKGFVTYNLASDYGVDLSTLSGLKFVTSHFSILENTFEQIMKNQNIRYLSLESGSTEIDFSRLRQLEELVILYSDMKDLDLSKNTKLKRLVISHSHIHGAGMCPYDDQTVNDIYSKLPSVVGGVLTTNIPFGDKSVAEKRGWGVTTVAE